MTTGVQLVREELRPFAEELLRLLAVREMSQAHFADLVNLSPSAISQWTTGRQRPELPNVEAAEDVLHVSRGHLGRLLGYLSGSESPRAETLREFLERDGQLTAKQQVVLIGVYDEFLLVGARPPTRRPRRPVR